MPKFEKDGRSIETSLPAEGVQLRAEGWCEVKDESAPEPVEFDQGGELPSGLNEVHNTTGEAEPLRSEKDDGDEPPRPRTKRDRK